MENGKAIKQYYRKDFINRGGVGFNSGVISQNGTELFTTGGIEQIFQFKIEKERITLVSTSDRIIQGRFEGLCISAQSNHLCAPSGGGNYHISGIPQKPYSTYVYAIGNLKAPVAILSSGPYPLAVGFDLQSGLVYTQNFQNELIIFNANGIKLKEYKLGNKTQLAEVRQFLVHPQGRKVLVLGDIGIGPKATSRIWSVELPQKQ